MNALQAVLIAAIALGTAFGFGVGAIRQQDAENLQVTSIEKEKLVAQSDVHSAQAIAPTNEQQTNSSLENITDYAVANNSSPNRLPAHLQNSYGLLNPPLPEDMKRVIKPGDGVQFYGSAEATQQREIIPDKDLGPDEETHPNVDLSPTLNLD